MWDGRGALPKLLVTNSADQNLAVLRFDLSDQANAATRGHAQAGRDLTDVERQAIVDFETGLSTAQVFDFSAGALMSTAPRPDPRTVGAAIFCWHQRSDDDPTKVPPTVEPAGPAMTLFSAWATSAHTTAQASVARGEAHFNSRSINITGVNGLNDGSALPAFRGTCATCHDTPNVGNHSVAAPLILASPTQAVARPTFRYTRSATNQPVRLSND